MNHDKKRLISYLLTVVMLITALFGSAVSVSAADVKFTFPGNIGDYIDVNAEENIYRLKKDIKNALEITLKRGETVILDGQDKTVGSAEGDGCISVTGDGTLILCDIVAEGQYSNERFKGIDAIKISGNVNLILQGTVTGTGGTGTCGSYVGPQRGGHGLVFSGQFLAL